MLRTVIMSRTSPGKFAVMRHGAGIIPTLETDGVGTHRDAQNLANSLNQEYQLQQARLTAASINPADRPIVAGFYDDKDAS